MIFKFKGRLFRKLFNPILFISLFTTVLCIINYYEWFEFPEGFVLPSFMGAVLGILIVFRNNTAYDKWWEARKILGCLVNTSRNFALQVQHLFESFSEKDRLIKLIAAYPFALKEHLREGVKEEEIQFINKVDLELIQNSEHKVNAIANQMIYHIIKAKKEDAITDFQMLKQIENVDELIDILGKCERIKNTPMPLSHSYLLKVYIFLNTLLIPLGFINSLEWYSIPAVAIIYYVAMSIVVIAEEIEEPFGHDIDDLPTNKIAENIYNNIQEIHNKTYEKSISSFDL